MEYIFTISTNARLLTYSTDEPVSTKQWHIQTYNNESLGKSRLTVLGE